MLIGINRLVLFPIFPFAGNGRTFHAVELFSGFGHEALVAVCALMIAGQGLIRTGALEPVGHSLASCWKAHPEPSMLLSLLAACVTGAC